MHRLLPRRVLWLVPLVVLAARAEAAADLTGHWYVEGGGADPFTSIVQTGSAVTFTLTYGGGSSSQVFTGSVSDNAMSAQSSNAQCQFGISTTLFPDDVTMDGTITVSCSFPQKSRFFMSRCDCFDGNSTGGDGCDAQCRTEPCFVCTGDPSTCTGAADAEPCDDRNDCTTGETCSAGSCGGGSPIPSCRNLTGRWFRQFDSAFGTFTANADVRQRDGVLVFRQDGGLSSVGTIDTATGAMSLEIPSTQIPFCNQPNTFGGTAAADSETYSGGGTAYTQTPHGCFAFGYTEQGFRCGGGTVDPGEGCDDGNLVNGDGCSDRCQVERCFACSGEPSSCAPEPAGTTCDDGSTCTTNDTCNGGGVCGGTPEPPATPCDDADPCTTNDACSAGVCVGTPIPCGSCTGCSGGVCIDGPRRDCHGSLDPPSNLLQVTDRTPDTKDGLKWRWRQGAATMPAELGNPSTTNAVAACLYDESGPSPTLVFRAVVPPGGNCGGKACWKPVGQGGFKFKSKAGAEGITRLSLRPGAAGDSKVDIKGDGIGLSGRPFGLPAPPLALPLRMQVQVDGGACFETTHGAAGAVKNEAGSFKGYGTP